MSFNKDLYKLISKKNSDFAHSSCSMDGDKIEEVALTCNKSSLAYFIA